MSISTNLFLLFSITSLVLLAVNLFLVIHYHRINKKIDQLLEQGNIKDFKDIFLSQKNKNDKLENEIKDIFLKIKEIEETCEITIQKVGVVRFNPFNDMGGNQSFTVAMLDNKNNGFIISSLFIKADGSRVFAKTIKNGKSDYVLSDEETEAIKKAINSNG
jgi:hypothetical protein